jgi:hypothetical protein
VADEGILIYLVFGGLFAAAGVAIKAQDALIGEKRSGTAAWVLSKPISRYAFLLAKFAADVIGVLITMVIVQGAIGCFILKSFTSFSLHTNGLAAMGPAGVDDALLPVPDVCWAQSVTPAPSVACRCCWFGANSRHGVYLSQIHAVEPGIGSPIILFGDTLLRSAADHRRPSSPAVMTSCSLGLQSQFRAKNLASSPIRGFKAADGEITCRAGAIKHPH